MTAIVLYGSSVADTTLTNACKMSTTTGGGETSKTMTFTGTNAYGEIMSQGGTYATVTALPAPTGHGWVYQPGAGTFANAAWTAAGTLSAVSAGVSATLRFYKYSAGTYTSIGSATTTITGVGKTTYSYVTASLPSTTFGASDLLYVDYWWFDNAVYAGTDDPTVYVSNSATAGVINDMEIVTASFTPAGAFTTYLSNAASTTLTTANKLYSTSGSPSTTSTSNPTGINNGSNLGWSEFYAQGGATWAAVSSTPPPSGHGFLWDVTTLEGQQINAGNWSGTLTMVGTNAGAYATITIDARAYKRSSSEVYTLIVEMLSSDTVVTFNGTNPATVTLTPTSASAVSFATGDKLYLDIVGLITYATGPNESIKILDLSTDTSGKTGSALAAIVTPGYQQPTVSKDAKVRLRQQSGAVPHDAHARFGLTTRVDAATRFGLITMSQDGAATRFGLQLPPDPPLSIYGLHSSSTTLPTAALTGSATGGASSSFTTLIGTSTGYGELWGLGNAGAWAAGGSLPAPDGQGWIWDTTTLEGQTLLGGTFSISHRLATSTAFTTFAATLFGRVYKYSAVNSTYTQIGGTMSVAANLTTTTTLYTMSASLPAMNFSNGDKLYFDSFLNITTSTGGSALATVRVSNSSDASLGILNQAQLTTAGYTTTVKMVDASSRFKLFSATTGYSYKKSLTIDHTKVSGTANLTNFPTLINHTDANLKTTGNGGHVTSASGFDIIFTDATGTTKYNHELINYNAATGAICAWVQVPSVSFTVDTVFQVYYGNAAITTSQESIPATWDANYLGVYHLDDNPAGTAPQMKDSTGHQAGTTANMVAGDSVTGQIFKGTNFNGTNKYINVGTTNSVKNSAQVTVSAWLKITALNTAIKHDLYSEATSAGTTRFNFLINTANHIDIDGRTTDAGGQATWVTHTTTLAAGTWYYCVGIYDSITDVQHVIVNGVDVSATVVVPTFPNTVPSTFTAIGAHSGGTAEWLNGILEESRISNTARTVGWAITEYNNQLTPTTFYSQGTETSNATTTTRDATARFRLQSPAQSKDARSRLRLLATRSVDALSRFRQQSGTTFRGAAARFRLQAATPRALDALARLRLLATTTANVASRLRLRSAQVLRDGLTRFRLIKALDAISRYRLLAATSQSLSSRFRLNTPLALTMAWMYPGSPACNAPFEYADGRRIDVLKPQYYALQSDGTLVQNTVALSGCNGYSAANATDIKKYSTQQFVTISGLTPGMDALATDSTKTTNFINTLTAFLTANGFTGIELDLEGFGLSSMSATQYADYKTLVTTVGNALHASGFKLMIDGPAIFNATYQGFYRWHWEDFDTLPVDYLVVLCYDFQFDNGSGTAVAPLATITSTCTWMQSRITDPNRIVIGLNSYGYHGTTGSFAGITIDTQVQSQSLPGFGTATRDAGSGEMMWATGGVSYDYSDTTTLDGKRAAVYATGLRNISVWHLGGNQWFSNVMANTASRFRLQPAVLPHDLQSRLRLLATRSVDQALRFRQQSSVQNKDAASRLRLLATKRVDMVARYRLQSGLIPHDSVSRLRVQSATQPKDSQSRFRLAGSALLGSVMRLRLLVAKSVDSLSRFRLQSGVIYHDLQARYRLVKPGDMLARFRLVKALDAVSRLRLQSALQIKDSVFRFRQLATKSLDGLARFRLVKALDTFGRFRLVKALDTIARLRLQSGLIPHDLRSRLRLLATTSRDAVSRLRVQSPLQNKDSQSRLRLLATKSVDVVTRYRLLATKSADSMGRFRLGIPRAPGVLSRFMQQSGTTLHDLQARFRLQQLGVRSLDILSRFRLQSGTTYRGAQARFALVITPLRDVVSRLRLQSALQNKDSQSRFRQLATKSVDMVARLRVLATKSVDSISRFRLVGSPIKDVIGRYRLQTPLQSKDSQSRLRLLATRSVDSIARYRLLATKSLDAISRFRLQQLGARSLDALSRFRVQSAQQLKDSVARLRLLATRNADQTVRFRQQSTVQRKDSQSRYRQLATKSLDAIARLRLQPGTILKDARIRFLLLVVTSVSVVARLRVQSALVARDTLSRFRLQIATLRALDAISRYRLLASKSMSAQTRFRLSLLLQGKDAQARFSLFAQTWYAADSAPITITFRDAIAELAFRDGVGDLTFRDGFVEETFY